MSLKKLNKRLAIVGIPSCLGGNIFGCHKGPDSIRKYLVPELKKQKIQYRDYGNVKVPKFCTITDSFAKCLKEITKIHKNLYQFLLKKKVFNKNNFPVLVGGDHSLNYSFIRKTAQRKNIGLIWFDAHGDFNTPKTTLTGNVHGMVLAELAGKIIKEENICIFGVRDLDPLEKKLLQKSKVTVITIKDIQKNGIRKSIRHAVKAVNKKTKGIHLSFDLDVFDPSIAPGTGTPVKDGLKKKELKAILDALNDQPILSADIMELNPLTDKKNKTAKLAAEIIYNL